MVRRQLKVQEQVGARIRVIRKAQDFTLDTLAEAVSLASGKYLGQIERGEVNPTLETLEKIASGLRCEVDQFFRQDQDESISQVVELLQGQSAEVKQRAVGVVRALVE